MRQPAHKFLEEFPIGDQKAADPVVLRLAPRASPRPPAPLPQPSEMGEAYARGYEEGLASGRLRHEAEMAVVRDECERLVEEAKQHFADKVAVDLAHGLRAQIDAIHADLDEQVAAVLTPILHHALTEATVREMSGALRGLACDGEALTIELAGPDDLIERVWQSYVELDAGASNGGAPIVRFRPGATTEVRAAVNGTILESRLMEWIGRLAEAVR